MPIVKNAASSLSQGVSQQAESQRFPSQATEQINAYSSHIKGLVKRPPTKYISPITIDTAGKGFAHAINRDKNEQYVVVVNPYAIVEVHSITVGTNSIRVKTEVAIGDEIRVNNVDDGGILPRGLREGTSYFVKGATNNNDGTWGITLSLTAGGALVKLGKEDILKIEIESVRAADDTWLDGVFSVTFNSTHGFSEGDEVAFTGLTGSSVDYFGLGLDQRFVLRKPAYNMGYVTGFGSTTRESWPADKFLLGKVNGDSGVAADYFGYFIDRQYVTAGDADGWTQLGDASAGTEVHWTLVGNSGLGSSTGHQAIRLQANAGETWPSGWNFDKLEGALVKLGTINNHSKAIRARVVDSNISDRTITLEHYIDCENIYFDNVADSPRWFFLGFWADTTTSDYGTSNPRRIDNANTVTNKGYVGVDAAVGDFRLEKGGIALYDVNTGGRQTLKIEGGLDYIYETNNPNKDLRAVTVADYTFLLNKNVQVRPRPEEKYEKIHEAFITVKTADYGKQYKINVGDAISPALVAASAAQEAVSYVDIDGKDSAGALVPVMRLQAIDKGYQWDNYLIRIIQDWKYDHATFTKVWQSKDYEDTLPRKEFVLETGLGWKTITDNADDSDVATAGHRYFYVNEKVSIHTFNGAHPFINIHVNMDWASKSVGGVAEPATTVRNNATTVQDIITAFEQIEFLKGKWEIKTLEKKASGLYEPATTNTNAVNLKLNKVYLGKRGSENKKSRYSAENERLTTFVWFNGQEESINWHAAFDFMAGGRIIITAGYRSPSALDTYVERSAKTVAGLQVSEAQDFGAWDGTGDAPDNLSENTRKVEPGEFFYKTPKWTGEPSQQAIGTERIAEMLASNCKVRQGYWAAADHTLGKLKANGRPINYLPLGYATGQEVSGKGQEECLGLTFQVKAASNYSGWLCNYGEPNSPQRLGKFTDKEGNWRVMQQGYTIAIEAPNQMLFSISVDDDLGGKGLGLTYYEADETSDLPSICRHGHVVKIVGLKREESDDYYLRFEADNPNNTLLLQEGRWVESVGYDQKYLLDNATMPVALVKDYDDSGNKIFILKRMEWNERMAGDDLSNPFPSFTGNTINDIFLYRNRLGFLSGENVILSEAGEYFNFFRTTTAALLESAPIDVTASTNKVSTLRSAMAHNEKLLIFSEQTQFVLDGEPYLSPRTVSITPTTEFTSFPNVKPVISGKSVFFGFERVGFSGVSEFMVSAEDVNMADAKDITGHCPKYLKGSVTMIAASPTEDVACFLTDDTTSGATFYIYKYFTNAEGQKAQSAWFKYTLGVAGDLIEAIDFIGTKLFMIIKRDGLTFLESLTFEDSQKDAGMDYQLRLDRKLAKSEVTVTSNTTVTLPYKVTANTRLVSTKSVSKPSTTTGTTTFTVTGMSLTDTGANDYASDFFIGEVYEMSYTFSQNFLKTQRATESGRYQIQRAVLEYANARSFDVDVIHNPKMEAPNKVTNTHTFATSSIQQELLGGTADLQEGFLKVGIQERNDRLQIILKNNLPYPSDFLSIDYEARAYSHGSRWRG
jgi:hypothetical protein